MTTMARTIAESRYPASVVFEYGESGISPLKDEAVRIVRICPFALCVDVEQQNKSGAAGETGRLAR